MEFVMAIVAVVVGYILGRLSSSDEVISESFQSAGENIIRKLTEEDLKPGVIKRPDASQLRLRNEDPKIREGKEEMKKAIEQSPDLVQAKEYLDKMKGNR